MIVLSPIATVHSSRTSLDDDDWDRETVTLELAPGFDADALEGIEAFSHAEVLFHLHRIPESAITRGSRHPRGNPAWPRTGIFAQRGAPRPNRLAATIVRIVRRDGRTLHVTGLDAVDGSPVVDIKPVMREFLPRGEVRQPAWATELMRDYWSRGS